MVASGEINCSDDTFTDYVNALKRLFVIEDIEAWCPAIRSKTAIRSSLKRSFCDPSIAVALLGLSPEALSTQLSLKWGHHVQPPQHYVCYVRNPYLVRQCRYNIPDLVWVCWQVMS